ncbi:MAG: hypothetical protein LBS04_05520 [Tannerellaceae bacterium]|jgi:hypothetical protein|nr:hypothetical protein [Tannerellaceae bacterium]
MKLTNVLMMAFFVLCSFGITSCGDDEGDTGIPLQPSIDKIEMEDEGGEIAISLNTEDFIIAGVVDKTNGKDQYITGEIYAVDGESTRYDERLYLEGMGQLQAAWNGGSFCIVRDTPSSLKVIVDEKITVTAFGFAIILQSSKNERKAIVVRQKGSEGYTFDKIAYALPKAVSGLGTYITPLQTIPPGVSGKYPLYPYHYIDDTRVVSYFRSDERNAFAWMDNGKIEVEVPSGIKDNLIYYDKTKHPYDESTYLKPGDLDENTTVVMDVPAGKSAFYIKFNVQYLNFPYALTLTNNRTGAKKEFKGTWIEGSFTGDYEIVWIR